MREHGHRVGGVGLCVAAMLSLLVGGTAAYSATVGVITSAGTPVVDVVSTGLFSASEVTVLYPQGVTPTLLGSQDEPLFDAVLVYSNASFVDPAGLGDVLADYVDAGGGVVLATFCFSTAQQYQLAGRLVEPGGESPFRPAVQAATSPGDFEWPPLNPCHPIFEGLTEAPTYLHLSNFGNPALNCPEGGCVGGSDEPVLLARTESGDNLAASNAAGTVIAINMHARAGTIYNDAGTRLFANALLVAASGGTADCNANGAPDECDIADGTSADCQGNGRPDECDLASGSSADCNGNGIPDECELTAGSASDCNGNDVPDACEIDSNTPPTDTYYCTANCDPDCNLNGVPDSCEPGEPGACDCNANMIYDADDIAEGTSEDCNTNGLPDECESASTTVQAADYSAEPALPVPDGSTVQHTITVAAGGTVADVDLELDVSHTWDHDLTISLAHEGVSVLLIEARGGAGHDFAGTILDDEADGPVADGSAPFAGRYRPEEVLTALDGADQAGDWTLTITDAVAPDDGVLNAWSLHLNIEVSTSLDCNGNGVLDECDIAGGTSGDSNGNGVPDDCETDCNLNGVPDETDLAAGTSADCNGNAIPDECDRRNDPSIDCNDNLIPDECDIAAGTSQDSNGDGAPDECVRPCSCGDLDTDGLVTLADFATFALCFTASDPGNLPPGCTSERYMCSDLDGDGLINLADFATFSLTFFQPPDNANCNW